MESVTDPIDQLHADCLRARAVIRDEFTTARQTVARWQPAPYRKDQHETR